MPIVFKLTVVVLLGRHLHPMLRERNGVIENLTEHRHLPAGHFVALPDQFTLVVRSHIDGLDPFTFRDDLHGA